MVVDQAACEEKKRAVEEGAQYPISGRIPWLGLFDPFPKCKLSEVKLCLFYFFLTFLFSSAGTTPPPVTFKANRRHLMSAEFALTSYPLAPPVRSVNFLEFVYVLTQRVAW